MSTPEKRCRECFAEREFRRIGFWSCQQAKIEVAVNANRRAAASGKVTGYRAAKFMKKAQWSDRLENEAYQEARKCAIERKTVGALPTDRTISYFADVYTSETGSSFISVKNKFAESLPDYVSSLLTDEQALRQMINENTTHVGCTGVACGTRSSPWRVVRLCAFSPGVVANDESPYETGAALECEKRSMKAQYGLCV